MKSETYIQEDSASFKERPKGLYNRVTQKAKIFFRIFCIVIALVIGFVFGSYFPLLSSSLQENKSVEITNAIIEEKLSQIGELATCSFEYKGSQKFSSTREILGKNIPGTTNSIDIIYCGVIKVGYDVEQVEHKLINSTIHFTLPEPKVLDNYIKLDDLHCTDDNNILNPIGSDDVVANFDKIEKEELKRAEAQGIYDKSEAQMILLIKNFFAEFEGYDVAFD